MQGLSERQRPSVRASDPAGDEEAERLTSLVQSVFLPVVHAARVEGVFLERARRSFRLYVVVPEHSFELQALVTGAELRLLELLPDADLDVMVRATQGRVAPEMVASGNRVL